MTTIEASITFHEDDHTYWYGLERIPSVSEIMRPITDPYLLGIPEHILEHKRQIGVAVHKACELWDAGLLDEVAWAEQLQECGDTSPLGYLEAWKAFSHAERPDWVASERVVFSEEHRYAGTLDRAGAMRDAPVVLDIKTTAQKQPHHGIQLRLYDLAYSDGARLFALRLAKDGSYVLDEYNAADVDGCARGLLAVSRWQREKGKK
jgi:hypothetical protein